MENKPTIMEESHYTKALEEGEKLFDERFVKIRTNQPVVEGMSTSHYPAVRMTYNNAKSFLTSFAEKIRQAVAEDVAEWAEGKAEQQRTEGCPGQCVRDTLDDLRNFLSDLPTKENN